MLIKILYAGFLLISSDTMVKEVGESAQNNGHHMYDDGLNDHAVYDNWVISLPYPERDGAEFWKFNRNLVGKGIRLTCVNHSESWMKGCNEAFQRLAAIETRRQADKEYSNGWNSYDSSGNGPIVDTNQNQKMTHTIRQLMMEAGIILSIAAFVAYIKRKVRKCPA